MRATRRTFRTAAIATGAIAALAAPTAAAFAADTPSAPQGQVAQDDQTDNPDQTGQDTDTPQPGSWESKGTTDLGKGWSAKVDVNASARTAKASISLNGTAKGSLTAYENATSTTIDGNAFTLTPDGTVTAKLVDKDKDKDKPVPGGWVSKGTANLGKGWSAKVDVNASARTAKASISLDGTTKGSLKAYIDPASTKIDGNTFKLSADGTITRTEAKPTPPKPQPKPVNGTSRIVPKGGVKAGAEGVKPAGESAPLMAAGGGMAALGAAGLGFALYRRKQDN
ncbi:hypothetical protein ACGFSB_09620 [Streptomyces sp. NPDC048441]|uniref:hypothetical protein n=1 Tax=Streptomyces sp. NPDC048441 TaxID=3365552 RepID=UPI0037102912